MKMCCLGGRERIRSQGGHHLSACNSKRWHAGPFLLFVFIEWTDGRRRVELRTCAGSQYTRQLRPATDGSALRGTGGTGAQA